MLVGQLLDHILAPAGDALRDRIVHCQSAGISRRHATGRLLKPVVRPRGPFAWLASGSIDGRIAESKLLRRLGWSGKPEQLQSAMETAARPDPVADRNVALLGDVPRVDRLSVRETLAGRNLMLIGVTGFIGKVWLVDLLENVPQIGKITLLIRRNRTTSAQRRFEKIVEESPTFDRLQERLRPATRRVPERKSGSGGRRREPARTGHGRGDAGAPGEIARSGGE